MRQLTALDQQFLALEDSRNYGHVGALSIYDPATAPGGTLTLPRLQTLIAERLPLVPPFRWRLAEVPLNLDYGYWLDDPEFDLEFHVREIALAPSGAAHASEPGRGPIVRGNPGGQAARAPERRRPTRARPRDRGGSARPDAAANLV